MITGTVIPLYNSAPYLEDLFHSILQQSKKIDQIVFVDDCSQDNTIQLLKELISEKVTEPVDILLIKNRENMGISNATNLGISELNSDYLFYSGHDDIWRPNRVQLSFDCLSNGENFVHSYFKTVGLFESSVSPSASATDIAIGMLSQNRIGAITVAINIKNIGKNNLFFNSRYNGAEDYDLWTDLIANGQRPHCIQEVLMDYRTTVNQLSRNFDYKNSFLISNIQIKYFSNLFPVSLLNYYELIRSISQVTLEGLHLVKINLTTREHLLNIKNILENEGDSTSAWKYEIYLEIISRIKTLTQ